MKFISRQGDLELILRLGTGKRKPVLFLRDGTPSGNSQQMTGSEGLFGGDTDLK